MNNISDHQRRAISNILSNLPRCAHLSTLSLKSGDNLPQRCKSRGCCRSKTSEGAAIVYYRKPLATKDMPYTRLSRRVKNMPILFRFWNSLGVDSRYLRKNSLKLYDYCLLYYFGMFFMQLRGLLA